MTSVTINIDLETKPGEPLCSRTIEMPLKANMLGFHGAIQSLFCWKDAHPFQFVSPKLFFVPGDTQSIVSRVGGENGYPAQEVKLKDMLARVGDQIVYNYGDWRLTIAVTETGGHQRKRAKILEMKGPIPVENARQAPGGWGAMWKALKKLNEAKTKQGQHVIYNRMSKKERASVDFLGGVHKAYGFAEFRKKVGTEVTQKFLATINLFPNGTEDRNANQHYFQDSQVSFTRDELARISQQINQTMNSSGHLSNPEANSAGEKSLAGMKSNHFIAKKDHRGGAQSPLSYFVMDEMIAESRSPWDVVLRVVEELSPYPQVAEAMAEAMKNRMDADLTAEEIETMVEPLRECVRLIGSDEGKTSLDDLAKQQWQEFSNIIGHDFSDPESQTHCLTAYLKAPLCFGLSDVADEQGFLTLTPLGRDLLAEADFCMDEVEHAHANRKLFDQVVSRIPYDAGPFVIHMAAKLGMLLAHEEMQEIGDMLRISPNQVYEETLHSLLIGLGIHNREGMSLINGYSDVLMHFLEFSGLIDVDLEEGTQKFNATGQRFVAMCLRELNYGRTVEGLKQFLTPVPVLY